MPNSIDSFDPFIYDTPVNTGYFKGYISNFRITGAAVYTGNFTPPSVDVLTTSSAGFFGNNTANIAANLSTTSVLILSFTDLDSVTRNASTFGNIALTAYGSPTINTIKTGLSSNQYVARRDETSATRMQYFDRFDPGDVILISDPNLGFSATANVISVSYNSITFSSIATFPTTFTGGMTVQNLSSFVSPLAQVPADQYNWRSADTPQKRLLASRYPENSKTVRLSTDRRLGENITSNIGVLQSLTPVNYTTDTPGDLRLLVTGIDTTPFGNTVTFYLDDNDFLVPYTKVTGNVTTLSFAYQDAVPFPVNSNVRIIDTTTGFNVVTQVLAATNSTVTANVFVANIGATVFVEKDYSLVYPQTSVKPTTRPKNSRELFYYLSISPRLFGYRDNVPRLDTINDLAFRANITIQSNVILGLANNLPTSTTIPIDLSSAIGRYWYSTLAPGRRGVVIDNIGTYGRLVTHQTPIVPYQELVSELDDYLGNQPRRGQATYTSPGTYTWTAPPGVTRISVVAIGAGGGGSNHGEGGGGGGLGWGNVSVVPGTSYTVQVGSGGVGGTGTTVAFGANGGASWFGSNTTIVGFGGSGGGRNLTSQFFDANLVLFATGEVTYTVPGSYFWTAPSDVTTVSVVAIGGGGSGGTNGGTGGGGGGLGYKNNIAVIPGQSYLVVVGIAGSVFGGGVPFNGGDSFFINTATVRGGGGVNGPSGGTGGTFTGDGGGNGGAGGTGTATSRGGGGGGAGGYSGTGGAGGNSVQGSATNGGAGTGGAGGGGGGVGIDFSGFPLAETQSGSIAYREYNGGPGGGVGLFGSGGNGAGGTASSGTYASPVYQILAGGGSGGSSGNYGLGSLNNLRGGLYGGGGGGVLPTTTSNGEYQGSGGAVRIIWGSGRSFPSTAGIVSNPYTSTFTLGNPGGGYIGQGGGWGGAGGTWSGQGSRGGAGGGGAAGFTGNGGRGGDSSTTSSVNAVALAGQGGGAGGGYGSVNSGSVYDYLGSAGGSGGGTGIIQTGVSGSAGNVATVRVPRTATYEVMTYTSTGGVLTLGAGQASAGAGEFFYEGVDCTPFLSSWSNQTTFNMTQMGGFGSVTAHGHSPSTWFFCNIAIPAHTQVRFNCNWHFVDSVDSETSYLRIDGVDYLQFTKVWNVAGANGITTNLCSSNSANGGNFTWTTYNGYSYAPWGGNRGDGFNGHFYVDTGWINHTAGNISIGLYIGPDQAATDEASYISHVRIQYRSVSGLPTFTSGAEVTFQKVGTYNSWDGQVYSLQPFTAPCTIEFNKKAGGPGDNGVGYAMIGWNDDPTTNASYNTLDYCSYPYRNDAYSVHHNGTEVQLSGSFNINNKFYVVYGTDGFIRHFNGSTQLYSVNYGQGKTVYLDSSFYSLDNTFSAFSNVKVTKNAWDGTAYAYDSFIYNFGGNTGSNGTSGSFGISFPASEFIPRNGQTGGLYGGGGSGGSGALGTTYNYTISGGNGAGGAVRIIYGTGTAYPVASNVSLTTGNAVISQANYSISTSSINNKPRDLLYYAQRAPGYQGVSAFAAPGNSIFLIGKGQFFADEKTGYSSKLSGSLANILKLGLKKGSIWELWQDFPLDRRVAVLNKALYRLVTVRGIELSLLRGDVARQKLVIVGRQTPAFDGFVNSPRISFREVFDQVNRADNRYFSYLQKQLVTRLVDVLDLRRFGRLELRYKFNFANLAIGFTQISSATITNQALGRLELFKVGPNSLHPFQDPSQRKKDPVTFWT